MFSAPSSSVIADCTDKGQNSVPKVCTGQSGAQRGVLHVRGRRLLICAAFVGLAALILFSLRLAAMRIFHVDECAVVHAARVLATSQTPASNLTHFGLFELSLAWLTSGSTRAIEAFVSARLVMFEWFWLNILLIALATGEKLLSIRGLIAVMGAATLAPLWDYGFEIRPDNAVLTGLLVIWCVARVGPAGLKASALIGGLTVLLQFVALKSLLYTLPISFLALAFPHDGHRSPRWKRVLAWLAGGVVILCAIRLLFGMAGMWESYRAGVAGTSGSSTNEDRFGAVLTLGRLLTQTPLLLAVLLTGAISLIAEISRRGKVRFDWAGLMPEAVLASVAFVALLMNSTPQPYHLVLLVPCAYLFAIRYAFRAAEHFRWRTSLAAPLCGVLLFTHFVPFWLATRRHSDWSNSRQEGLMRRAEDLTDPAKDPVYDSTGMVCTRRMVRSILAATPPAVYIPSYRTDGLAEAERKFLRRHYVSFADDFWVLGRVLTNRASDFEIAHAGRYRISTLAGSDLAGTYPEGFRGLITPEEQGAIAATLDGLPLTNQVVDLSVGAHHLETATNCSPAVVWVGPKLGRIHRVRTGFW